VWCCDQSPDKYNACDVMSLLSTITEKNKSERVKLGKNNSPERRCEKISQSGAFLAGRALQGKQKIFWDWPNMAD